MSHVKQKSKITLFSKWLVIALLIGIVQPMLVSPHQAYANTEQSVFEAYSFGDGSHGQLGHSSTDGELFPNKINGMPNIKAIAAGWEHSLILTVTGDVYSFGSGSDGQLGHGDTSNQIKPKKIDGLSNVTAIAAGWGHSLILTESGEVYSFGSGNDGQLGHGDTSTQLEPKKIEELSNVTAIAAGWFHSLILTEMGEVYSFGSEKSGYSFSSGISGQLGHGDRSSQLKPKKIDGLSDVTAIAAGWHHSLILTETGDVYSFGYGLYNPIGRDGNHKIPGKIEELSNVTAIAAGGDYSLILTDMGDVYSFGYGSAGQLGHGDTYFRLAPTKIQGLMNVIAIAAGGDHSLILTEMGDVYSFGDGSHGQLGYGLNTNTSKQLEPQKIEELTNVIAIAAGRFHSLVIRKSNNSSISPNMASFDINEQKQEDITVNMELNDNTLIGISNETTPLAADRDYTVNGSAVTISKEYLSTLTMGTTTLTFTFSTGADQSLEITVSDSTPILSDDANLTDLHVDGQTVIGFAPEQTDSYSVSIPYDQTSIAITYTTSDANATVQVVGDTNLVVGDNTVTITVTGQKGNTKDYTIIVTRAAAPTNGGGSTAPITPVPPIMSTDGRIVIPAGRAGEVRLGDEVTMSIPSGVADQELTITIEKLQDIQSLEKEGIDFVSPVYELLKNITNNFKKPVTLTFKFDPTKVNEGQIPAIYYYDEVEQEWIEIGGKIEGDRITVDVDHFTKFAVLVVEEKPEITFSDITGHWAEEFILEAARLGIIKGHVDGTFKPDNQLTRAQAVSILVRALDLQTDEVAPFKDMKGYAAETQAEIAAAYKYGLVIGQGGNFMPSKKVSRSQMALMLHRAYEQKTGVKYVASEKAPYPDIGNYDEETVNAISMLYEMGIATGSNGTYMPANPTTRAQAAKMFVNFFSQD